jgi:hypothetical protein
MDVNDYSAVFVNIDDAIKLKIVNLYSAVNIAVNKFYFNLNLF